MQRSNLRSSLLARIRRRYQTSEQELRVGRVCLNFTRVADPDRVLNAVAVEADRQERLSGQREPEPLHLPYWAELWDSALGVAQFLTRGGKKELGRGGERNEDLPSFSVSPSPTLALARTSALDLGCGMGLTGTVAAALGADVTFADLEAPALLFARINSLPFDPEQSRTRTRRLNWQTNRLGRRFDLILGADILYERSQWDFLEPFWRAHLAPGGCVLLGEPGRPTGEMFDGWIRGRGWLVEELAEAISTRPRPIRILRIRTASSAR
jgi:SAM-dependent methyltransferase